MSDVAPPPPFIYEGLDPAAEPKSTIAEVSEAVRARFIVSVTRSIMVGNLACP